MKHLLLAVALCATTAHAEFFSGNKLLSHLNGDASDQIYGMGYIIGVFDSSRGVVHCPPNHVTVGQVKDMVHQYLRTTPESRHFSGDSLVNHVLRTAWPCANRGRAL